MNRKNSIPINTLGRWFGDHDFETELEIIQDIIENDLNFQIVLYRIDHQKTDVDEVYGETQLSDVKFKTPTELFVIPTLFPAENKSYDEYQKVRVQEHGEFSFDILLKEIEEKKTDIIYGDVIGYPETEERLKYFQVFDDGKIYFDNQHKMYGYKPYYRSIRTRIIDPNQFSGK